MQACMAPGISRGGVKSLGRLLLLLSLCCRCVYQTVEYLYVLSGGRLFDAARGKHLRRTLKAACAFFSCTHEPLETLEAPSQHDAHERATASTRVIASGQVNNKTPASIAAEKRSIVCTTHLLRTSN